MLKNFNKTLIKLYREFYWKPRYRLLERLEACTGIDLLTFKKLEKLRNAHHGERVIVMGNGPSLGGVNLNDLVDWTTFASNKIYLAFDKTEWRPTYFSVEDDLVIDQNISRLSRKIDQRSTAIMPYIARVYRPELYADIWFGYSFRKLIDRKQYFGIDAREELYNGYSIVYTQIQLAIFMGAKEIALVGVDFSFNTSTELEKNGELIGGGAVNHFFKDYRLPGERWNPPLLDRQNVSFALAEQESQRIGVKIFNCTPGSKLEAFERMPLEEYLMKGRYV